MGSGIDAFLLTLRIAKSNGDFSELVKFTLLTNGAENTAQLGNLVDRFIRNRLVEDRQVADAVNTPSDDWPVGYEFESIERLPEVVQPGV